MIRFLFILLFFVRSCVFADLLAPHPISLIGPMGETGSKRFEANGKSFVMGWDGAKLDFKYGKPPKYGEPPINEGPPRGFLSGDEPPRPNVHLRAYISLLIYGGGSWTVILTGIFCTWQNWLLTTIITANAMAIWTRWCLNHPNKK